MYCSYSSFSSYFVISSSSSLALNSICSFYLLSLLGSEILDITKNYTLESLVNHEKVVSKEIVFKYLTDLCSTSGMNICCVFINVRTVIFPAT